jgi:hypothetical protein
MLLFADTDPMVVVSFRNVEDARMFYLDHVDSDGGLLFEQVRKMDLEGIVYKKRIRHTK